MIIGILSVIGVMALWSITPTLAKIALGFIDPYTLTFLRLIQGLALVILLYRKKHGGFRGMYHFEPWIVVGCIGITVNYLLFVTAFDYTTASMGGLVIQIQFVTLAVLSWIILKERFHIYKVLAVIIIIGGVLLVFFQEGTLSDAVNKRYIAGNIMMVFAGLGWGTYALANKAMSHRKSNFEIIIPVLSVATLAAGITALFGFEYRSAPEPFTYLAILILGVGVTGVGFLLISIGLRRLNASVVGAVTSIYPVFNIILARRILGEQISTTLIISAIVIVAGVLGLIQADQIKKR